MSNSPLVSVIIPALNADKFLEAAVDSILQQTYTNLEVILIDDNSKDSTWDIMNSLTAKDERVRVFRNRRHLGVGGNRNKGIELSKGEYIAWQDADDISAKDRIELQVKYLQSHNEVGVVGGYLHFFGDNFAQSVRKYKENDKDLRKTIFRYNPVAQPVAMVRKECFGKVGNYNAKFRNASEDLDIFFKIGTKYRFANVQKVLLEYRQFENSATFSHLREMELETIKLRLKYSKDPAYSPNIIDYAYNIAQLISAFIVPPKIKIKVFNLIRNS